MERFTFKVVDDVRRGLGGGERRAVGVGVNVGLGFNAAGDDGVYGLGDTIEITATFGQSVTVTGTPRIPMTVGANTRHATYRSGSRGRRWCSPTRWRRATRTRTASRSPRTRWS